MQNIIKGLRRHSFWLSLLLHALVFVLFILIIWSKPEEKKTVPQYVPAYTYTGKVSAYTPPKVQQAKQAKQEESKENFAKNNEPVLAKKEGLLPQPKRASVKKEHVYPKSMLAASLASLKQMQMQSLNNSSDTDPILLVGDMSHTADPLIKLMGQSLSAHFRYPDAEGRLGIKGRVVLELTLYPDGHFDGIRMVKSSDNHHLDSAALYAANTAPTIYGVDRFISTPKHFVIGFIFD